jgi:thiol-disulfide isomerase/thioredoxin
MLRRGAWQWAIGLVLLSASALAKPRPREPARIISLDELRGTIEQHRGRVVVLHLWATWCMPCMEELPLVGQIAREARNRGVDVLSVSLDDPTAGSAARVARVLNERGSEAMSKTIVRMGDPDAFVASIDPRWEGTIPAFFAYDRAGKMRRSHTGALTKAAFDRFVNDLVAEGAIKK